MNEYIVCFMDDNGKSLVSKTNKYNEFEIFKKFIDWCAYKSGYLRALYEQQEIKNSIDSYMKDTIKNEYIDESHRFTHKIIILDISITRLKPRKAYTKSLVINIEVYLTKEKHDKISFDCIITNTDSLYSLDCLTI